jgi:hypothetical protein
MLWQSAGAAKSQDLFFVRVIAAHESTERGRIEDGLAGFSC